MWISFTRKRAGVEGLKPVKLRGGATESGKR